MSCLSSSGQNVFVVSDPAAVLFTAALSNMVDALFVINKSGDVFLEKHWKSVVHRSTCDYFFDAQSKHNDPVDIPLVIETPHHYLFNVYHEQGGVFFVAVCSSETAPLFVVEFIERVIAVFAEYFGDCTEALIKEHYVVVYELLDEMLDNGFPLATELNVLKELIRPPNVLRSIANTVTGGSNVRDHLPSGQLSSIPWRRSDVRYTNNEAYFDVIELVDAIVDRSGGAVMAQIHGHIDSCVKLSGVPDLAMSFVNPRLLDDLSFHPCVRLKRWQSEKIISFIPPDGNFRLLSYTVGCQSAITLPLHVRHSISLGSAALASSAAHHTGGSTAGRLEISISPRANMGRLVEDVHVTMQMPKHVSNCMLTASHGRYTFEPSTRFLSWQLGRLETSGPSCRLATLRGTVSLQSAVATTTSTPPINITFLINQMTLSGVRVSRLDMYGEHYKPFKGVKYMTKAGQYQIRT